MEKRLIFALLLSLATIFAYTWVSSTFFAKPPQQPTHTTPVQTPTNPTPAKEPESKVTPEIKAPAETKFAKLEGQKDEELTLDSENHRVVFTTHGGLIHSLWLKKYFIHPGLSEEEKQKPENWVQLIHPYQKNYSALRISDPFKKFGVDLNDVIWTAERSQDGRELTFRYSPGNGVTLTKKVTFPKDSFHALVSLELANQNPELKTQDWILEFSPTAGIAREAYDAERYYPHPVNATGYQNVGGDIKVHVYHADGGIPAPDATVFTFPTPEPGSSIAFTGDYNKYFAALSRPVDGTVISYVKAEKVLDQAEYDHRKKTLLNGVAEADYQKGLYRLGATRPGLSFHLPDPGANPDKKSFLVYYGSKDPEILQDSNPEYRPFAAVLKHDVWVIGRFLMWILRGLHSITFNYAIAIILLTLLVRAALFPISRKQQLSMAKFQKKIAKIKPLLDSIEKKHKDAGWTKMNEEKMKVYKEHGVTTPPIMGCLPMLLQIPVFIGLFSGLQTSFDLRHASFLWVSDLARPDQLIPFGRDINLWLLTISALNVLPLIMVVVWIWQQRSMPLPADPQQAQMQKMMAWMPLLFGFMLYNYAAGLSIYMITSSLSGVFEQRYIKKQIATQGD